MTTDLIDKYDFAEDAMGLGDFIANNMGRLHDDEIVVYVEDGAGRSAEAAYFLRETLTDGSTTVNLIINFGPKA